MSSEPKKNPTEGPKTGDQARRGPNLERWRPKTKIGHMVRNGIIKSIDPILRESLRIKETEIITKLIPNLSDVVLSLKPVQKMTGSGQRMRFKAVVVVGDKNGHIGLGYSSGKEAPDAIRNALNRAKLQIRTIRLGYYAHAFGEPHTIPVKSSGKCGSVRVRILPAARGSGIVASYLAKTILELAGVKDCYTKSKGSTATKENTAKAIIQGLLRSSNFMRECDWEEETEKTSILDN